jgi:UDP-glucose 4-epimerase
MRVLVTGGAGFIGSHLVARLLRRDVDIRVIDNLTTGSWENLERTGLPMSALHYCDIRHDAAAGVIREWRPEVVVHLAAQTSLPRAERSPRLDADINVRGTVNLLEAGVAAGVRQFVYAASCAIYGAVPSHSLPVREEVDGVDPGPYGRNKREALDQLERYRKAHDLSYTALVLGNVYGPRPANDDAGVIRQMTDAVLRGTRPVIHGDGTQTRDFVHVDDVVRAILRAFEPTDPRRINIGSGTGTRIVDVLKLVNLAAGRQIPPRCDPALGGGVPKMALDISTAAAVLGWRPTIGLARGVRTVVRAARQDLRPQLDVG